MTLTGHCLCGAVRLEVADCTHAISACHCEMCRRWSGSAMFGFEAEANGVRVSGPVRSRATSAFAERAWCEDCGSHLWIRDTGKSYELAPGLFNGARDFPLIREVYADRAFAACRLSGDHERVTQAAYEADHLFVKG